MVSDRMNSSMHQTPLPQSLLSNSVGGQKLLNSFNTVSTSGGSGRITGSRSAVFQHRVAVKIIHVLKNDFVPTLFLFPCRLCGLERGVS